MVPGRALGPGRGARGRAIPKGEKVFAEGQLRVREYEGNDGQKRSSVEIRFARVISLERRDPGEDLALATRPAMPRRPPSRAAPRPQPPVRPRRSTSTTFPSS